MFDTAMAGEVEDGLFAESGGIEIARMYQQFIIFGFGFRDDLAIGIDNETAADQRKTILDASFGDGHNPRRVLVRPGLDGQAVMEQPRLRAFVALLRIDRGRVVTK